MASWGNRTTSAWTLIRSDPEQHEMPAFATVTRNVQCEQSLPNLGLLLGAERCWSGDRCPNTGRHRTARSWLSDRWLFSKVRCVFNWVRSECARKISSAETAETSAIIVAFIALE
jgi:hypothetical protein